MPPSTEETSVVYTLHPLNGNAPNSHFFFFPYFSYFQKIAWHYIEIDIRLLRSSAIIHERMTLLFLWVWFCCLNLMKVNGSRCLSIDSVKSQMVQVGEEQRREETRESLAVCVVSWESLQCLPVVHIQSGQWAILLFLCVSVCIGHHCFTCQICLYSIR